MELVGPCTVCGKDIYCKSGFLDGVTDENSRLYCHDCYAETHPESKSNNTDNKKK